jgi:hypothetical protein
VKEATLKAPANKQWYRDFEIEITNTSNKPIYYFNLFVHLVGLGDESTEGIVTFSVFLASQNLWRLRQKYLTTNHCYQMRHVCAERGETTGITGLATKNQ